MRARHVLAVAATGLVGLAAACLPMGGASVPSTDGFLYQCIDQAGQGRYIDPGMADEANTCTSDEHEVRWPGEAVAPPEPTTTEPTTEPPTTEPPSTEPTTTVPATTDTTAPPAAGAFPTAATTGADETVPLEVVDHDVTITTPGALVMNERFTNYANLFVTAPNVLVKNVVFEGGRLNNDANGSTIGTGMDVEDVTFTNVPGTDHNMNPDVSEAVTYRIGNAGYTADNVKMYRQMEGFRIGGDNHGGGDVTITNSYVLIDTSTVNNPIVNPDGTGPCKGHPDGVQAFGGLGHMVIRHNTFDEASYGGGRCNNAALFLTQSSDSNTWQVLDNALLGGGYTLRPQEGHFTLTGNRIGKTKADLAANPLWGFGPVLCNADGSRPAPVIDSQADNTVVAFDASYNVTSTVQALTCKPS